MTTMTLPIAMPLSTRLADVLPGTPRMRRRLLSMASPSPTPLPPTKSTATIVGDAQLCFSEDFSWFEGHLIATSDESQYGLVGKLCPSTEVDDDDYVYDVSVLDHDAGETYALRSVVLLMGPALTTTTSSSSSSTADDHHRLCSLTSPRLRFSASKSFRGQMADMLIQRVLTPRLVGKHLVVYAGQMSVDLAQLENLNSPSEKRMWYKMAA